MKKVLVHWVETRTLEVPDECPTDNMDKFEKWLYDRQIFFLNKDPYSIDDKDSLTVGSERRDFEIVDVEAIVPENEKMGTREDIHQR